MTGFRKICSLALAVILLLATPAFVLAQTYTTGYKFWVQANDDLGVPITSGVVCQVYDSGAQPTAAIYSSTGMTPPIGGNLITGSSAGTCTWYAAAATAVDVYVWHRNGRGVLLGATPYTHVVQLGLNNPSKIVRIPYSSCPSTGSVTGLQSSAYTIPKGAFVNDVIINTVTVAGGNSQGDYHIAVGTYASDRGFCGVGTTLVGDQATMGVDLHASTTSHNWLRCHAVFGTSTSAPIDKYIVAFHSGSLISTGAVGGASTHAGVYSRYPYISKGDTTNDVVVWTVKGSKVAGHIYLLIDNPGTQN